MYLHKVKLLIEKKYISKTKLLYTYGIASLLETYQIGLIYLLYIRLTIKLIH